MNLDFLREKTGLAYTLHLLVPAVLIGALPCVIHYLTQEVMLMTRISNRGDEKTNPKNKPDT